METTKQWLVILGVISSTASTLIRPAGPNLKYDLVENLKSFSPVYPVMKILWLILAIIGYRMSRIMSTRLIVWLTFTIYCHWQTCPVDPSKLMKHSTSVVLGRRVLLIGVTLPTFFAMLWLDDHRLIQFLVACSVGDAVLSEVLTVFSLPSPGSIYFHENWPKNVLLGPGSGAREITTIFECRNLLSESSEDSERDNTSKMEELENDDRRTSTRDIDKEEASIESKEKEISVGGRDNKQDKPQKLPSDNLCDRVQKVSESLLGTDGDYTSNDICTVFRCFLPVSVTWTCRHWNCFIYYFCSVVPLELTKTLGQGILVIWMLQADVKLLLPIAHSMILNHPLLQYAFFIVYETIFVIVGIVSISIVARRLGNENSTLRSIFDRIVDSLVRRTGASITRIKRSFNALFIVWPLQLNFYFFNPVPMAEKIFWGLLTFLLLLTFTVPSWLIAERLVSGTANIRANGGHDEVAGQTRMGRYKLLKEKGQMTMSVLFPPVAGMWLWSKF